MNKQVRPLGANTSETLAPESGINIGATSRQKSFLRTRVKSAFDRLRRSPTPIGDFAARLKAMARASYRNLGLYCTDLLLAGLSLVLATIFRFGLDTQFSARENYAVLVTAVPLFMAISAIVFPLMGLYQRNWRYVSLADLVVIVRSGALTSLVFVFSLFAFTRLEMMPRSVVAIDLLILIPLLTAVRLRYRFHELQIYSFWTSATHKQDMLPILLVGAGNEADIYLRALQGDRHTRYLPVGLLDDSQDQLGLKIRGVPVLGTLSGFDDVMRYLEARNSRPRHIIFSSSLSKFGGHAVEQLVSRADALGITVSRLASATEFRNPRKEDKFEVRPIELTDLLERPQTVLDREALSRLIKGRRVLVTGAGGSIGSELTLQVAALGPAELILVDNTELNLYNVELDLSEKFANTARVAHLCNIREASRVNEIFDRHCPDLVFHAAALKHVPMVELNPSEGVLTNVIGTMNVAEAAKRTGAMAMVQISSDKVVNPTSVMGVTKRLAELYCQALDLDDTGSPRNSRFMTVRFGNVLGSSGSLIPLFQRQIARGGPLTVTHPEMTRFFMTIREAVELTLQASAYGLEQRLGQGEIFVLDMGEPIKIIDIARRMIRLAGYVPEQDIKIKIIGYRPGEKLYEELFDSSEGRVESPVPGVLGAVPVPIALDVLKDAFARLKKGAEFGDLLGLFNVARELLPNYRGPNSSASAPQGSPPEPGAKIAG